MLTLHRIECWSEKKLCEFSGQYLLFDVFSKIITMGTQILAMEFPSLLLVFFFFLRKILPQLISVANPPLFLLEEGCH